LIVSASILYITTEKNKKRNTAWASPLLSEKTVTIPLSKLEIAKQYLPTEAKILLRKEGINISSLGELVNKNIGKGTMIEVESGNEKIVISVE